MVSSIREKIWEVEREKKRQRRLAKEGVVDAVEKGEISAKTSDSDSVVESGEVKAKINKPKKKSKKTNKKT